MVLQLIQTQIPISLLRQPHAAGEGSVESRRLQSGLKGPSTAWRAWEARMTGYSWGLLSPPLTSEV